MIVVTGAAGFIGSGLVNQLTAKRNQKVIVVDDFSFEEKNKNIHLFEQNPLIQRIERQDFIAWFQKNYIDIKFVFHIGARTDTTEFDYEILQELNLDYTKKIWQICTQHQIPLVYASSAATYGAGEQGYNDDHQKIPLLKPLNPYGESKQDFDVWALEQESLKETPPFWAGLKFFNVYGPNEYHKGRMASVVFHTFNQIQKTGEMKLFRSHHPDYKDGEQLRDFVYVKDVVEVCLFLMGQKPASAIYNLGSGKARTFLDLATHTFKALGKEPQITFVDTPIDIRDKYQYFTQANMNKLKEAGYQKKFHTLEEGIEDYVKNYLVSGKYWK